MGESVSGTAKDAMGRAQDAAGGLLGDTATQMRGKLNRLEGQAENAVAELSACIRDAPITSVLIGVGIGYLLGRLRIL